MAEQPAGLEGLPDDCGAELHLDLDGYAVSWGLSYHLAIALLPPLAQTALASLERATNEKPKARVQYRMARRDGSPRRAPERAEWRTEASHLGG